MSVAVAAAGLQVVRAGGADADPSGGAEQPPTEPVPGPEGERTEETRQGGGSEGLTDGSRSSGSGARSGADGSGSGGSGSGGSGPGGSGSGDGGSSGAGRSFIRKAAALGLAAALVLLVGIIAVFTVDDDSELSALPDMMLGVAPVESEQLTSAGDAVAQRVTAAGVENVQSRFYGESPDAPTVFLARGAVPESAENPRSVLDAVERELSSVYGFESMSQAREPGGAGIRCAGTQLPDAGESTVCAFAENGSLAVYTLFGVAPETAQTQVLRAKREVVGAS